jgi:hypothetical protein
MSNGTKINIFLLLAFMGMWLCKQLQPKGKVDEVVVDGIHIPKEPCISAVNGLFGKGVDSSKVCDCLIPQFYDLIKHDTLLTEKFKQYQSIFKLEGQLSDSTALLFASCARVNILDTNYKLHFTREAEVVFIEKLKKGFRLQPGFSTINTDSLSSCIVKKLNGNVTIKEFLTDDYLKVPKIKELILQCSERKSKG